jgi:O-antigen/teichoic acid export membrane protein/aminoglycoside phosphotransferase (APT) family kinase protein
MLASTQALKASFTTRLLTHIQSPLHRNGYALVFNSTATSALGILYWMLAARAYTPAAIGMNSALLSAMIFLANLAQLNMTNGLNRFVPTAGRATARLILSTYSLCLVVAAFATLIFIAGTDRWAPSLAFLQTSRGLMLSFTLATMAWSIFVLQDSVLVGLRQATWVPVENLIFALAKLLLLVGFAYLAPTYGIFASWALPMILLLAPVNWLIFKRLLPHHSQQSTAQAEPISVAALSKYVAGDYLSSLVWTGTNALLPVIVLERAGATANAYFYIAWTIAYSLALVSRNMGMSLIAEAATDQSKLALYTRQTFVNTTKLLLPMIGVIALGAHYLLFFFGPAYVSEAAMPLRLLALAALPTMVTSLYISIARVQRRIRAIVITQTVTCALALGLTYLLLGPYGITGVGIAWLGSQTLVALILLATELRSLWVTPVQRFFLQLLTWRRQAWWHWTQRQRHASMTKMAAELLATAPSDNQCTQGPIQTWQVQRLLPSLNEMSVALLGNTGEAPTALLKIPHSASAQASLRHQQTVLTTLRADTRLAGWQAFLPQILATGNQAGVTYFVESAITGVDARHILDQPTLRTHFLSAAANVISEFHQRTAQPVLVDADCLQHWVDEPLALLQKLIEKRRLRHDHRQALQKLRDELYRALQGRRLAVGWAHGDFSPGNIMIEPHNAQVVGIIDWEAAAHHEMPQLDLVLLLLSTRMAVEKREMGEVVCALLQAQEWQLDEQQLLTQAQQALPGESLALRDLVLLCWLRHVAANLRKSHMPIRHWIWVKNNVARVLHAI